DTVCNMKGNLLVLATNLSTSPTSANSDATPAGDLKQVSARRSSCFSSSGKPTRECSLSVRRRQGRKAQPGCSSQGGPDEVCSGQSQLGLHRLYVLWLS